MLEGQRNRLEPKRYNAPTDFKSLHHDVTTCRYMIAGSIFRRFSRQRGKDEGVTCVIPVDTLVGIMERGCLRRTADLGVMNHESAAAYKAFQRINRIFREETVV
jgi:hypothetical protein